MKRRFFGYLVLTLTVIVYIVSSSEEWTRSITYYKNEPSSLIKSDKFRFGDLYGMSYLPQFRQPFPPRTRDSLTCNTTRNIDLYAICDSYLWSFVNFADYYCGVDKLVLAKSNNREPVELISDSSKSKVLLIEMVERNIRGLLYDSVYVKNVILKRSSKGAEKGAIAPGRTIVSTINQIDGFLFNKEINTNIESNIWDVSFFTPVKEMKASINYRLFGSMDKNVKLAADGKRLFYDLTIDTSNIFTSSFNSVSQTELEMLVSRLNLIAFNAKKEGFDEVLLSLIPNPVSVIEPKYSGLTYNRLIERIQSSPNLQMEYIDLMPVFAKLSDKAYFASDTHWNFVGAQAWVELFNQRLVKISKAPTK